MGSKNKKKQLTHVLQVIIYDKFLYIIYGKSLFLQ